MTQFETVGFDRPMKGQGLVVYPLMSLATQRGLRFGLAADLMESGDIVLREVENPTVGTVVVQSKSRLPALLLEGDQVQGARQDRVANRSVLIAAGSEIHVPVSCVEHGRWRPDSEAFTSSRTIVSPTVRSTLKGSVTRATRVARSFHSDQSAVWDSVTQVLDGTRTVSRTSRLTDVLQARSADVNSGLQRFQYRKGATGLAISISGQLRTFDLFGSAEACESAWPRIVTASLLESGQGSCGRAEDVAIQLLNLLQALNHADTKWATTPALGLGDERRTNTGNFFASALTVDESLVHASAVYAR